jgi:putative ABC transport system permease protein
MQALRYACRALARSPGFSAVAALTLALGIGSNVAIFSLVRAVLLPELPYREPSRLAQIHEVARKSGEVSPWVTYRDTGDFRAQSRTFESLAMYRLAMLATADGVRPESLYGVIATPNLLPMLGVAPAMGRFFDAGEGRPGDDHTIVLSDDFWRRSCGADPQIVGKKIRLLGFGGNDWQVVGVMPRGFNFPLTIPTAINPPTRQMQYWIPMTVDPMRLSRDGASVLTLGRLRPGATVEQADADIGGIAGRLAAEFPQTNGGRGAKVTSLSDAVLGNSRRAMWTVLLATALVVLIACANIANLLLARSAARWREMAVRVALGAGARRLAGQAFAEAVVLAGAGAVLGVALAWASRGALIALAPVDLPGLANARIDPLVLGFAALVSLAAAAIFGLAPAWRAARTDPARALAGARGSVGPAKGRGRDLLVVAEVALSVLLTISAGLLIKSFSRLLAVDPGYKPDRVMTAILVLPQARYVDAGARVEFWRKLVEEVRRMPGVEAAGAVAGMPLSGGVPEVSVRIEGVTLGPGVAKPLAEVLPATTEFLATMGIPVVRGRTWTASEAVGARRVAVVSETAAERFWPGQDPIGKRIGTEWEQGAPWYEVVGVSKSTRDYALDLPARPAMYVPMEQMRRFTPQFLTVRTAAAPKTFAAPLRQAVERVDKDQSIYVLMGMQELLDNSVAQRRFGVVTLGVFGAMALILAAAGIYGVVSYSVTRRTQEIGVRMAMGAHTSDIARMVVGHGLKLTAVGVGVGLAGALAATRLLAGLLYGVKATDPAIFAAVPLLLGAVEALACWLPARRAMRVDPMTALRSE